MELLMSFSIQRETSDGTLSTLDLTIEYIDRTDIRAYVNDIEIDLTGGSTPYTWEWITDSQIEITPVVPNGLVAMLKRSTPMEAMYHIFDAGAVFKDETVDENFKQVLFLNQEAKEGSGVSDIYGNVNMHGYVIGNHGAAVLDGDLVTFGQYRNDALGAGFNRVAAEAARDVAVAAKDTAVLSAANAATSESNAALSETAAEFSATAANDDRVLAENAAALSVAAYDSFDDRYLGAKAADPTLDNDGAALIEGALYWNTVVKEMRVFDGTVWIVTFLPATGYLEKTQNLIDLDDVPTARSNLGLGTIATQAANNVAITGGDITGITDLAIADGGTGASTAATAFNNLKQAATDLASGVTLLATSAEVIAGSVTDKTVTPSTLATLTSTTTRKGLIETATSAEVQTGSDTERAVVPSSLHASSLGLSQTWQVLTGSRSLGVTYTNSTGKPIAILLTATPASTGGFIQLTVGGVVVASSSQAYANGAIVSPVFAIVPNGATYSAANFGGAVSIANWSELRT